MNNASWVEILDKTPNTKVIMYAYYEENFSADCTGNMDCQL